MWKLFLIVVLLCIKVVELSTNGTFLYFAYGSNLLAERIHINSPTAVRAGIGKLNGYRLDFGSYASAWRGAVANIANKKGSHIWGALWNIDNSQMKGLDKQEGLYLPITVNVTLENGTEVSARTYQLIKTPPDLENIEDLPMERRPSPPYLRIILAGAKQSALPEKYQKSLQKIPHNGYFEDVDYMIL